MAEPTTPFEESDLRTGIPITDIPESGFEPITMTLEPPQELPSPRQFVPTAIEDTEAFAPVSLEEPPAPPPTQDIAELEAGGFEWPEAEPTPRWKPLGEAPPIISISPERPQYTPVDEAYAKTADYFDNGFRDEKFLAAESDIPEIRELEKTSFDPNNVRVRAWNWGYLQWRTGRKFANDGEYEAARDADNKERNPNKPVTSDSEYFNDRKKEAEFSYELKGISKELSSRAILKGATDYAQGKPMELMPLLDELRKKYPALNEPELQERATLLLRSAASEIKQNLDPLLPQIGKMMPFVQNIAAGKDVDESIAQLKMLLLGDVKTKADLTPDKIKQIDNLLGMTALGLHSLDPEGKNRDKVFAAFDNMKKALVRPIAGQGLFGLGGRDATLTMQEENVLEARRRLDAGQPYVYTRDGRPRFLEPGEAMPAGSRLATPEERANFVQATDDLMLATWFEDKIRDRIERDIDPIKTVLPGFAGTLERTMVYGPLQSAGFMATGLLPRGVADVAWWWTTRNGEFRQLMRDNPTMAREDANRLSNWSATWQAPLNRAEAEVLFGRLPGLKGIFKDIGRGDWKSAAVKFGLGYAAEAAAENTQNFISNITQAYGNQIADEARATDPSWSKASEKAFRETVAQMPDTLLTIAPMMLIGAGITHLTDYRMSEQELIDRFAIAGLMSQGLSREQADRVMAKNTWEEREKQFQKEYQNRDPATMREANAKNAAAAAESQAQFDKQATAPAMPSFESRRLDDGTQEYTVRDPDGNVVMTTTNRTVFEGVYQEQVEKAMMENLAAQEAAAATEEGQAATAEAEGALRVLEPESRTSAAYLLEFDDEQRPTPERAAAIARLEAALAKDPRSSGRPVKLIPVTRRVGAATVSGQKLNETIESLGRLFGKDIVFVRSGTGEDLPFTGIVNPSDPNTIFLDAAGDRNVLALIGHEWSHTLKLTNPQLHAAMVAQMRPLVHEWLNQEARLKGEEGYTEKQVTDELVGNIIGDAFTRPDFMRLLAQRNPSLFERVVRAIEEFFQSLIAAARGSEWATEGFITDLEAMHEVIASTIEQARTAGPEVAGVARQGELSFAGRRKVEQGFYRKVDEIVDTKLPNTSTPQQAKATINSAGLKAEEIKWTGVIPAIDRIAQENNGKVPKAELERYLENEGKVKLEEVTLGEKGLSPKEAQEMSDLLATFDRTSEQQTRLAELSRKQNEAQRPKFGTYQLPGGENYREVVMSMPSGAGPTYTSSHFPDIPNYVAHMRLNDRTDAEGNPGTFLEELQSDRHQQGREKGYERIEEEWLAFYKAPDGTEVPLAYGTDPLTARAHVESTWNDLVTVETRKTRESKLGVPDAPFRKDWPLALFKRALRDAVSLGKQWIGWTNGETQAERYDLSKQVEAIRLAGDFEQSIEVSIARPGEGFSHLTSTTKDKLSDVVGKEIAEKAITTGQTEFRGLDLKIGGEGMKGFYDKILPNEIGKYVKQWGGKVEQSEVDIRRPEDEAWYQEPTAEHFRPIWRVEITPQMKEGVAAGQLQFATRRGKAAQAKAEGISREESIAAAFERMHAAPEKRLSLLQRIKAEYFRIRAENASAEAAAAMGGAEERDISEMRRVHAFAELNALTKALPPAIRGRIGGALTLAQIRTTEKSLTDFLTKRIAMIDRELERALKKEYTERIKDLLARFKPKRAPSGVVKGRIGSDAQDVVTRVAGYVKMTGLEVESRMKQIESELAAGGLDAEAESALLIEQHELSTFGAIEEMSAAELDAAHASLQDTIATGRAAWGASEEARLDDMRAKAAEIVDVLPPATAPGVAQKNRSIVLNWLKNYARNHTSFVQVLGRLFPKATFVADWESRAIKQDSADIDYVRQTQQRLVDAIGAALGTTSTVKIGDALSKMDKQTIPVPGGKASQREAIQYLFAWGQPQVRERMLNQGWTPAHIVALQEATRDPVSQALMAFFQQEYEAIYQKANLVYQKLYGMNLPRIEGTYAPMRYHGAGGPADISPTGVAIQSGVTPSAIKGRVAHSALLRQVDSLSVFSEHLAQMSHWIHFAEFIRETRGVLNNAGAKLAIEQAIGAKGLNDLQKHLDSVTRNGVMRASDVSGTNDFLSHITKGTAISSMAFNLHSAAVQGDSALRWMAAIPIQRWGNVLLAHRWLAAIPKAWHSDTVQRRVQGGMNPAVRFAMEQNNFTPSLLAKAVDVGFWPINLLDGAATAISSAIVYADSIQQGMSEEQALRKMDEAVARFSQPIAVTSKTQELATAGSAKKMLLMFMADPMLKTSIAMDGMLDIGRGKVEQGFRKIVAVELWSLTSQLILNTWAHYITGDDEEDEDGWLFKNFWRAAIVAPVQGFFVLGNIAEGIVRAAFGEKWWKPDTAVGRFVGDVVKAASHWEDVLLADPSDPDFQKEVSNLIKVGGTIAGSGWAAAGAAVQKGVAGYQKLED